MSQLHIEARYVEGQLSSSPSWSPFGFGVSLLESAVPLVLGGGVQSTATQLNPQTPTHAASDPNKSVAPTTLYNHTHARYKTM